MIAADSLNEIIVFFLEQQSCKSYGAALMSQSIGSNFTIGRLQQSCIHTYYVVVGINPLDGAAVE